LWRRSLEHTFGGQNLGICSQKVVPETKGIAGDVLQWRKAPLVAHQQQIRTLHEETAYNIEIGRCGPAGIVQLYTADSIC
jgi:hypothetical protein